MSLNLLKKGLECPGKVLEFHLHQRVDTLELGDCVGKAGGCGGGGGAGSLKVIQMYVPNILYILCILIR